MASGMQENFLKWMGSSRNIAGWILLSGLIAGHHTATRAQSAQMATPVARIAVGNGNHSASKTVLVLGDSLSAEYGLPRGTGWVPLLEQRLKAEGINAEILNASISGETTAGGKARLPALLQRHKPEIVILELGGNDGLRGLPMAATTGNLRDMINATKKTGARVLLLGMQIPPNYGADYTTQFTGLYPKIAKETGAILVPFFLEGLQARTDLFQADRIHPAAAAQPFMLNNVWPLLKPMLNSQSSAAAAASAKQRTAPEK